VFRHGLYMECEQALGNRAALRLRCGKGLAGSRADAVTTITNLRFSRVLETASSGCRMC
jgi:hypothetical protein